MHRLILTCVFTRHAHHSTTQKHSTGGRDTRRAQILPEGRWGPGGGRRAAAGPSEPSVWDSRATAQECGLCIEEPCACVRTVRVRRVCMYVVDICVQRCRCAYMCEFCVSGGSYLAWVPAPSSQLQGGLDLDLEDPPLPVIVLLSWQSLQARPQDHTQGLFSLLQVALQRPRM